MTEKEKLLKQLKNLPLYSKKDLEELIEEFLKSWDYMMERIEFHTENPDSELMDEVSEEYKKWEVKLK